MRISDWSSDVCSSDLPVEAALDDDLNTPAAIAELHELTSRLNRANDAEKPGLAAALRRAGAFLGLLQDEPDRWLQGARPAAGAPSPAEIEDLIVRRRDARRDRKSTRLNSSH